MGTQISRIEKEFVLGAIADNQIELRVSAEKQDVTCTVSHIDDEYVYLVVDEPVRNVLRPGTRVMAYFSYFGHVMTFTSTVRGSEARGTEDATIRVDMPDTLLKNLSRKYTRVPAPEDSSVSFTIQDRRVELNFPKTEEYDPVEPPELSSEFDPSRIESLLESFREKTKRKASVNTIVMFRDRKPAGFEERMISETGKILYIPNTAGRFPENDYQMGGRIITRAMMLREEMQQGDDGSSQDLLPSLMAQKREQGIRAEMYCPILFHEYVVGYIYLAQDREMEAAFDHDLLDFVHQFSKVLAYSLKINGYFRESIPEAGQYQGAIIDISASGILFCHESRTLRDILALYTDLDLELHVGDRKLRVVGRIMRKFDDADMTCYGVQFMEIKPEDFRFLFEHVYGRAASSEDEELWEGGAEPPELEL